MWTITNWFETNCKSVLSSIDCISFDQDTGHWRYVWTETWTKCCKSTDYLLENGALWNSFFKLSLAWCCAEISNKHSKRWTESNHTSNFWYLYISIHTFFNIMESLSISLYSIQSLKYSHHNLTHTTRMVLLFGLNSP